ncbi:MAG: hypothetical protein ABIF28_08605 [Pseudomonadota bacterium]
MNRHIMANRSLALQLAAQSTDGRIKAEGHRRSAVQDAARAIRSLVLRRRMISVIRFAIEPHTHHPSMAFPTRRVRTLSAPLCAVLLAGCASTAVTVTPSPQAPVCDRSATALVLWAPEWRAEQKDVVEREAAAAQGLKNFFASSGCFAQAELRRMQSLGAAAVSAQRAPDAPFTRIVVIGVRELGPVVKLLSSVALVEGGTEVLLHVSTFPVPGGVPPRDFTVHWRHGGPGVVKGVASLPADMQAALVAGLQPGKP